MLSSGSVRGVGAPDRPSEQQPEALAALGAPLEWSVHEVAVWLRLSVGLPDYVSIFVDNAIDGETLLDLQPNELYELGVRDVHHPTIVAALQRLGATSVLPNSSVQAATSAPVIRQVASLPVQTAAAQETAAGAAQTQAPAA